MEQVMLLLDKIEQSEVLYTQRDHLRRIIWTLASLKIDHNIANALKVIITPKVKSAMRVIKAEDYYVLSRSYKQHSSRKNEVTLRDFLFTYQTLNSLKLSNTEENGINTKKTDSQP